jgi:hypothetical protein
MKSVKVYWTEGGETHQFRYNNAETMLDGNTLIVSRASHSKKIVFNPDAWIRFEVDEYPES